MEEFHFIRPWFLLAIIPAIALALALFRNAARNTKWHEHIDERLLPYLLDGKTTRAQKAPLLTLCILWALACVAIAGPTWERKEQPLQRNTSALVLLWDLSPSMYAEDIKPSRLVRSQIKLMDILNTRDEGLTALISYSGDAHIVTPLTDDTRTIKSLLSGLSPGIMPSTGNNPEAALERAIELLEGSSITKGTIVFITDGIPKSAIPTLGATAKATQHRVAVWGIGTEIGAPIPLPNGGFYKNNRGEIIVAKTDPDTLSDAAIAMHGTFIPFSDSQDDIDTIAHYTNERFNNEVEAHNRQFDQWQDMGHWLALLFLPFAMLAFRKGWLLGIFVFGFTLFPEPSYALQWKDLWQTKDQQAQKLIEQQDYEGAANTFQDPERQAIANYKAGNYDAASELFSKGTTAEDFYNLGNSLTHQGKYDEAMQAYDEALKRNPNLSQAQNNKNIATQLKHFEEQQQNQQSDQSQQSENGEQQEGENQDGNNQQSDGQKNEGQEGENQQNQQGDNQDSQDTGSDGEESSEENSSQQASDSSQLSEEQQKALEEHYQQKDENSSENENTLAEGNDANENGDDDTNQEGEEKQESAQEGTQQSQMTQSDDENAEPMTQQQIEWDQLSDEEKEQKQALENWLRKVKDDPSGLLRNKFKYEYKKRLRESQNNRLRTPNGEDDERW